MTCHKSFTTHDVIAASPATLVYIDNDRLNIYHRSLERLELVRT